MIFRLTAAVAAFAFLAVAQTAGVGLEDRASHPMRLVRQTRPAYPPEAKAAGLSGLVRLEAVVARDGKVRELRISSGHPLLAAAAYEAVGQWEYAPVEKDGQPVEVKTQIDVNFSLADDGPPPLDVPGSVQVGKLVRKIAPAYPPEAKLQGLEGQVRLRATVGKTGAVEALQVLDGAPALVAAAVDAVREWQYEPTLVAGEAVPVRTDIDVNFKLSPQ